MIDSKEHDEVRDALAGSALSEERKADMARRALATEARGGAGARWIALAAAALVVLAVLPIVLPARSSAHRRPTDDDNRAFLERPETRAKLAAIAAGTFVAVVEGTLDSDKDLDALLARVGKAHPKATQRYLFRRGEEGEKEYQATFVDHPWAGNDFLAAASLTIGGGASGWLLVDEKRGGKTTTFPSPDGRPWLPMTLSAPGASEGRDLVFVVSTGSDCPLLVPEDAAWPLAEIPGMATLKTVGPKPLRCARYLVRVRIPGFEVDAIVEAVAVPGLVETRIIAGLDWRRLRWDRRLPDGNASRILLRFDREHLASFEAVLAEVKDRLRPFERWYQEDNQLFEVDGVIGFGGFDRLEWLAPANANADADPIDRWRFLGRSTTAPQVARFLDWIETRSGK